MRTSYRAHCTIRYIIFLLNLPLTSRSTKRCAFLSNPRKVLEEGLSSVDKTALLPSYNLLLSEILDLRGKARVFRRTSVKLSSTRVQFVAYATYTSP